MTRLRRVTYTAYLAFGLLLLPYSIQRFAVGEQREGVTHMLIGASIVLTGVLTARSRKDTASSD